MSSWAHSVLDDKGRILLVTSRHVGDRVAYYILLVAQTRRREFMDAMKSNAAVDLETYGRILRSGWGAPTEEDKRYLREYYQVDV